MPSIQQKRGTRAALDALATVNGIKSGEVYLLTDESRLAVGLSNSTYQVFSKLDESQKYGLAELQKRSIHYTECLTASASCFGEFSGLAISNGTVNGPATGISLLNRPGMVRLRSGTSANSGYVIWFSVNNLLIGGKELWMAAGIPSVFAATTTRMGLSDSNITTDATDGCYMEVAPTGIIVGKTANNSVRSITPSSFQLVIGTYYKFSIELNADATLATFVVRAEDGTLLWSDTLSTNIPKTPGREAGAGFGAFNSGTVATDSWHLDYQGVELYPSRR